MYVKYRAPRKPQPKEKKEWQAHNTQPILFGMDMCAFSQPLIITEGQIDCLSMYEAGIRNVVSVPSGCSNLDWIDTCWDWLERFQSIILFGDNDEPGRKMVREVVRRLDPDARYGLREAIAEERQGTQAAFRPVVRQDDQGADSPGGRQGRQLCPDAQDHRRENRRDPRRRDRRRRERA